MIYSADSWFAGFADGEGCFILQPGVSGVLPIFRITLRDDDADVLIGLQREFGGSVRYREHSSGHGGNPYCLWTVASKDDLRKLVDYFDTHPLRAKKARDYAIWRQAVLAYIEHGGRAPELVSLKADLTEGRRYLQLAS